MDLSRYRDLFVTEAREHLQALSQLAMQSESGATDAHCINEMFRRAHSIKGMAATMQYTSVNTLAHATEELLGRLRSSELAFSRQLTDLLLAATDTLAQSIELIARGAEPPMYEELAARIRNFTPEAAPAQTPKQTAVQQNEPQDFTFRISDSTATIKVRTSLLDRLVNIAGELLTVRHRLESQSEGLASTGIPDSLRNLSGLLKQLQNEIFSARMLPFSIISERFPRMVRDVASRTSKEIRFRIQGDDIELDRGVLELIAEPLVHMLRNSADHGIEPPSERVASGKPPEGSITLSVAREADHILITLKDDGRGIDPARIRKKALSMGLINDMQSASMSDAETIMLVCHPGFSTASTVTDISGRGVGMDVVQTTIRNMGGNMNITSELSRGTSISLSLPVSVAIIQALIAKCGEIELAIPVNTVASTAETSTDTVFFSESGPMLFHNNAEIELRSLRKLFRQPDYDYDATEPLQILMTDFNSRQVGLIVDRVLCQQEIFIRPLAEPLSLIRGLSGATVTGDGKIIFVTDTAACATA